MFFAKVFLRQKTQNRVLGRSAGVPCEVASGLRSHGFGAVEDDAGKTTMCRSHGFGATVQDSETETMCLRSYGFEAEADASGMMKRAMQPCDERHMLSDFKEEECKDGMIAKDDASSDGVANSVGCREYWLAWGQMRYQRAIGQDQFCCPGRITARVPVSRIRRGLDAVIIE